ncbi:sulfatase-like hydrolase/transferase [Sphingomonas sp. R-74633]|uniref:sulfatase-like hydrolase/transferase n=1 Tax=Sphingomonas sp. R-74633 TaxID=2751188 RepID=UPI0015D265A4|nr:sulfatase-like hydrolase/transferase [Sphingomonas sp. R-74633]NYT41916.1 sulfatase-like hydrolase/transferase [Sphingomonas sp. R-74633]
MKRRQFLKGASGAVLSTAMAGGAATAQAQWAAAPSAAPRPAGAASPSNPNIILLISDQTRAGLTKKSGFPLDTMPTADALAARGVDFARAYCTIPACVPSRISMLTGRWPQAHRVRMNLVAEDAFFDKDIYQVARAQGYRTGLCGKNHTYLKAKDVDVFRDYSHEGGPKAGMTSQQAEFEKWLKGLDFNVALEPAPFPVETQLPYRIVSDALDFMRGGNGSPFFLQVSFPEPHDPEQVPAPYWDMFPPDKLPPRAAGPEVIPQLGYRAQWLDRLAKDGFPDTEKQWRRYVSNYLGALRMVDDQIKRMLDFMQGAGLLENTIIVRVADHGDYLMDYGLARKGVGLPEDLTHIPMTWTGPGIKPKPGLEKTAFVSMADVMPTLCEAMGAEIPPGVQGRSLLPLLRGEDFPAEEFRSIVSQVGLGGLYYEASDNVPVSTARGGGGHWDELDGVTQSGNAQMVRMGEWKLIYDMMGYGQLYDLSRDPHELKNLFNAPKAAAAQARLMAELAMWTIRNQDSLPTGPQNQKYHTKWARPHNWYTPFRHGTAPAAFIP